MSRFCTHDQFTLILDHSLEGSILENQHLKESKNRVPRMQYYLCILVKKYWGSKMAVSRSYRYSEYSPFITHLVITQIWI